MSSCVYILISDDTPAPSDWPLRPSRLADQFCEQSTYMKADLPPCNKYTSAWQACEEGRIHMRLDHKNVVKALDFISDDSTGNPHTTKCLTLQEGVDHSPFHAAYR